MLRWRIAASYISLSVILYHVAQCRSFTPRWLADGGVSISNWQCRHFLLWCRICWILPHSAFNACLSFFRTLWHSPTTQTTNRAVEHDSSLESPLVRTFFASPCRIVGDCRDPLGRNHPSVFLFPRRRLAFGKGSRSSQGFQTRSECTVFGPNKYYTILYYTILYYTVLYCTIL